MEKNYYEILEVDKHASQDIIKKAYNTLAKKYHPDLQPEEQKEKAQKQLQLINEAYEVLSKPEKREEYNKILQKSTISQETYNSIFEENKKIKNIIYELENEIYNNNSFYNNKLNTQENLYNNNIDLNNSNSNNNYYNEEDSQINNYNSYNYSKSKIKYFLKNLLKNLIAILGTIFVLYILWHIPFIKKIIEENYVFNIISQIFTKK